MCNTWGALSWWQLPSQALVMCRWCQEGLHGVHRSGGCTAELLQACALHTDVVAA